MLRKTLLVLAVASALVACSKESKDKTAKDAVKAVQLQIAPEDLLTVQSNALASGPVITGSIQPERKADLRAEVSAVVLQVLKENGETVKRGDVLVKLDETAIRDSLGSAEASARALSPSVHHLRVCSAPPSNLALSEWTLVELADDFIMFMTSIPILGMN